MSEFSITSSDFKDGEEIPKKFGYKHGNETPNTYFQFCSRLGPKGSH